MHHTFCINKSLITYTNVVLVYSNLISNMWNVRLYSFTTCILHFWWVIPLEMFDVYIRPSLGIIRNLFKNRSTANKQIPSSLFLSFFCQEGYHVYDIRYLCITHPDKTLEIYLYYYTSHESLSDLQMIYNTTYIVSLIYNRWVIPEENFVQSLWHELIKLVLTTESIHCSCLLCNLRFFVLRNVFVCTEQSVLFFYYLTTPDLQYDKLPLLTIYILVTI